MSGPLNPLEAAWCDWLAGLSSHLQVEHESRGHVSRSAFEAGVAYEKDRLSTGIVANIGASLAALSLDNVPEGSADYQSGWLAGAKLALHSIAAGFRDAPKPGALTEAAE